MSSFPVPPPGVNPWSFYIEILSDLLYPDEAAEPNGFRTRVYVLFGIMGYALLISIAHLAGVFLGGKKLWLWRTVQRPTGNYFVGNQFLLFILASIISITAMLVYTVDCYNVFVLGDSQRRSTFIRTLCWAPMVLHGWFTSCATFQATCLQGQSGIPPVVANVVFVVGVLVILIPLLTFDIIAGLAWQKLWDAYVVMLTALELGESKYTGTYTLADLAPLGAPYADFVFHLTAFNTSTLNVTIFYIAIICALFLVNIAGLGLLLSLKKQLSFNVRRFRITSAPVPTSLWSGSDSATVSIDTPGSGKLPRRSSYMPTGPQSVDSVVTHDLASSKNLKHLILNGIGSRAVRDDARQILSMRKIQWDLTVFQGFVFSLLTAFLGVSIWTGFKATHDTPSWPAREAALLIVPWLYGCGVSVALSLLGYNSLRNPEAAISSVSVGSQRPNSQGSASGESDLAQVEKQDDTPFSNEKQRISFETSNATTSPHRAPYPLLRPNLSRADSQIKIPSTHTDVLVHSSVTCAYEDERVGQPQMGADRYVRPPLLRVKEVLKSVPVPLLPLLPVVALPLLVAAPLVVPILLVTRKLREPNAQRRNSQ